MATVETVSSSLNGNFKNVYGKKIFDLVPQTDLLYRNDRIKFVEKTGREGLQFNQPVIVTLPSSATWGLNGPTLNAVIAMQMANATVTGSAITMRDVLSYDSAARAATSEAAFEGTVGLVLRTLFKAHAKFAEIDLLYGAGPVTSGASLAQSSVIGQSGGAGNPVQMTITYGTWAPAMWSGFQNAVVDVYNGSSKVNTNGAMTISLVTVTPANSTVGGIIQLTGAAADENAIAALNGTTLDLYWTGAYGNNMAGIRTILNNAGSLFGINAATYDLWLANTFAAGSTQLTFSKVQQAAALAVSRGLDEDVVVLVSPVTFADLVNEQAGARHYDSSYDSKKLDQGTEALTFYGPSGKIEILPHMFVRQGEAYLFPPKELIKVGPLDHISPTLPGIDGDIFFQSPTQASYEVRLFSDFGLLNNQPAKSTIITGITNSQSA